MITHPKAVVSYAPISPNACFNLFGDYTHVMRIVARVEREGEPPGSAKSHAAYYAVGPVSDFRLIDESEAFSALAAQAFKEA